MLNAPKQSLKPSIFGCELRKEVPAETPSSSNIFAYGWGDTADSNFSLSDQFNSFESLTTQSVFTIPSSTKKIVLWLIGDTKPDTCDTLEDVFPLYCDFAECTSGTTCCSPLGVCCYNDGLGCTAPVSEIECNALGGVHDPTKFTCDGYDCNSAYAHCCDQELDQCPGCFTCFDTAPGAKCKDGTDAIPGACSTSTCDNSGCEDTVNNCVYNGGELTGCEEVCDSQAGYKVDNCDDCCYCEQQQADGECKGKYCCVVNKDTGGEECEVDCECANPVQSCDECNGTGLYSCDTDLGECRPDDNGVPYNTCAATCQKIDTSGYNCEEGSCVAVPSGAQYQGPTALDDCNTACGSTELCCECGTKNDGGVITQVCCQVGYYPNCSAAGYISCNTCSTVCGAKSSTCFTTPDPSPTTLSLLTALANRDNSSYPTVVTNNYIDTLNFGLDITCNVCNVAGRDPGGQILDCETRIPSSLKIEYILQNICSDDVVKLKISKTSSFINVIITVHPKENPTQEYTLYSDRISQSKQKDPVVGDFNCDICQFDYNCEIDGNSSTFIFSPPLSTFTSGPDTLYSHTRNSYVAETDRYVQSNILSIPIEENVWIDTGIPVRVEDYSYSELTTNVIENATVFASRFFQNGVEGKYISNTGFNGAYGVTCPCEAEGGCDSGYPINPGFIVIAGSPNIT